MLGDNMESKKNSDIRIYNRKRVVGTLFRERPMTKQELALRHEISLPTLNVILKDLKEKGLITKGERLESTGGRKPICITPVYDIKYAVGLEISKQEIHIVLVNLGGKIISKESHPFGIEVTKEYWLKVNKILSEFIENNMVEQEKLLGIGISLEVPENNGVFNWMNDNGEFITLELKEIYSCFDKPVTVHYGPKMAAIAQAWALYDRDDFVFLSIGSYIAGAMIYNENVVGFSDTNGQFGKLLVTSSESGKKVEDYCTIKAICTKSNCSNLHEFYTALESNEKNISNVFEDLLDKLAGLIYNLHCIFGWKIVIGGEMSEFLQQYSEQLEHKIFMLNSLEKEASVSVMFSNLGTYGAAVGSALIQIDEFLEFGYESL